MVIDASNPYSFLCFQSNWWESYMEGRRRKKMHKPQTQDTITNSYNDLSTSTRSTNKPRLSHSLLHCSVLPYSISSSFSYRRRHISSTYYIVLLVVISCLYSREVLASKLSSLRQRFANEPSPQTAVIGSTVVMPCRVINMVGELQWTKDDFGLGNERELTAFKRYKMIGSHEEGNILLFYKVTLLNGKAL